MNSPGAGHGRVPQLLEETEKTSFKTFIYPPHPLQEKKKKKTDILLTGKLTLHFASKIYRTGSKQFLPYAPWGLSSLHFAAKGTKKYLRSTGFVFPWALWGVLVSQHCRREIHSDFTIPDLKKEVL